MGTEARLPNLLTNVADGFAVTFVRNETQRHSTMLKSAGQSPIGLFPLDGFGFAVPSFQLRPVFGAVSSRVPPDDTMSCFVDLGDKSWDNFKNFFKLRALSFCFCPKGRGGTPLQAQYRRKRPFRNSTALKRASRQLQPQVSQSWWLFSRSQNRRSLALAIGEQSE